MFFFLPGNYLLLIRKQGCQSQGPGLTPFSTHRDEGMWRQCVPVLVTNTSWVGAGRAVKDQGVSRTWGREVKMLRGKGGVNGSEPGAQDLEAP